VIAAATLAGALLVPGVEFLTALWSTLGVSGTAYYLLHYRSVLARATNTSFSRSFLRLFPALLLVNTVVGDSWGVGRSLVVTLGTMSVILLFAVSYGVELSTADPDRPSGPGRDGGDGAGRETAP
jgi:hypothetical protein